MKPASFPVLRKRQIEVWTDRFDTAGSRLQMALTVALTGAFGFGVSYLLLELGVTRMAVRYPVAVLAAYALFLGLLWGWLALYRRRGRSSLDGGDLDLSGFDLPSGGSGGAPEMPAGGGGHFGGGGASSNFTAPQGLSTSPPVPSSGSSGGGGFSLDLDFGDGCAVVLPILVVLAGVAGSAYVVWTAPTLFAELIVDGVLVAAMYRRLGHGEEPNWLLGAMRRTWVPAVAVAVTMLALGLGMQYVHPEAQSIGAFWKAATAD